jgi:hypothetical protein
MKKKKYLSNMTKVELKNRVRKILEKYNDIVSDSNDYEFLISVFRQHPRWEIKQGIGINAIRIIKTKFGQKCFELEREDGSRTDISFLKCIDAPQTSNSDLKKARRSAVEEIVINFRKVNLVPGISTCPFTGEILFESNTHVDHYDRTFAEIFNFWILDKDKDYLLSKLNDKSVDGEIKTYFTDDKINQDFIEFHNNNTHLRIVSVTANLKILRK